jgi:hypothetical protein
VSDVNEPGFERSIRRGRTLTGLPETSKGETGIGVNINDISCEGGGAISAMQNSHYHGTTADAYNLFKSQRICVTNMPLQSINRNLW